MSGRLRPRRILFARSIDADNINAQSRNAKEILRRWQSSEWRPTALVFRDPDPLVAANPQVDILRVHPNRIWRARVWEIYQRSFDAIFYPGLHHCADFLGLRARKLMGRTLPIISTFEGLSGSTTDESRETFYSQHAGHQVYCQKLSVGHLSRVEWITHAADHIIAISPFLARLAQAKYGPKVSLLPLGIDLSLFRQMDHRKRDRVRIISAGNLRAHKRPEKFLEWARTFPAGDFCWFGEGDLREPLKRDAARLALTNLSFPGARAPAQLAIEMANADIFVLPSMSEGVPKVTQEAAAAGLAQIVFGYFETPSVADGVNGFVVWDDAHFTMRLSQLIDNPGLVARMGEAGTRAAEAWNWDQLAPVWEQRILETAERSGAHAGYDLAQFEIGKQ